MARLKFAAMACWIGLLAGVGALATAYIAQGQGLVPCALCYLERWPYRVAIGLGLIGLVFSVTRRAMAGLQVATLLVACGLACLHVGVERHFWKSPLPECAAPQLATGSTAAMLQSMPSRPAKPCDDPTYLVPGLKLSMAEMNMLYALLAALLVAATMHRRVRR